VGQYKSNRPSNKEPRVRLDSSHSSKRPQTKTSLKGSLSINELSVDLKAARQRLTQEDEAFLEEIYVRFSYSNGGNGNLSNQGLQLAMKAAGIPQPDSYDDQAKLRFVQAEVINHFRGDSFSEVKKEDAPNPLNHDQNGVWELNEFISMVAGIHEVASQEMWAQHEKIANQCNLERAKNAPSASGDGGSEHRKRDLDRESITDLWEMFNERADPYHNTITIIELQRLLATFSIYLLPEQLKVLCSTTELDSVLAFEEFVRVMVQLCDILGLSLDNPVDEQTDELLRKAAHSNSNTFASVAECDYDEEASVSALG